MSDSLNVVAPREEQPIQSGQWPGHTSAKFTTWKKHTPHPEVNQNAAHPLYAMGGKRHYDAKLD